MNAALAQWYLKKVADDLPAVLLVASWTSHSTISDGSFSAPQARSTWIYAGRADAFDTPLHPQRQAGGVDADHGGRDLHAQRVAWETSRSVGIGSEPTQPAFMATIAQPQKPDSMAGCRKGCCDKPKKSAQILWG